MKAEEEEKAEEEKREMTDEAFEQLMLDVLEKAAEAPDPLEGAILEVRPEDKQSILALLDQGAKIVLPPDDVQPGELRQLAAEEEEWENKEETDADRKLRELLCQMVLDPKVKPVETEKEEIRRQFREALGNKYREELAEESSSDDTDAEEMAALAEVSGDLGQEIEKAGDELMVVVEKLEKQLEEDMMLQWEKARDQPFPLPPLPELRQYLRAHYLEFAQDFTTGEAAEGMNRSTLKTLRKHLRSKELMDQILEEVERRLVAAGGIQRPPRHPHPELEETARSVKEVDTEARVSSEEEEEEEEHVEYAAFQQWAQAGPEVSRLLRRIEKKDALGDYEESERLTKIVTQKMYDAKTAEKIIEDMEEWERWREMEQEIWTVLEEGDSVDPSDVDFEKLKLVPERYLLKLLKEMNEEEKARKEKHGEQRDVEEPKDIDASLAGPLYENVLSLVREMRPSEPNLEEFLRDMKEMEAEEVRGVPKKEEEKQGGEGMELSPEAELLAMLEAEESNYKDDKDFQRLLTEMRAELKEPKASDAAGGYDLWACLREMKEEANPSVAREGERRSEEDVAAEEKELLRILQGGMKDAENRLEDAYRDRDVEEVCDIPQYEEMRVLLDKLEKKAIEQERKTKSPEVAPLHPPREPEEKLKEEGKTVLEKKTLAEEEEEKAGVREEKAVVLRVLPDDEEVLELLEDTEETSLFRKSDVEELLTYRAEEPLLRLLQEVKVEDKEYSRTRPLEKEKIRSAHGKDEDALRFMELMRKEKEELNRMAKALLREIEEEERNGDVEHAAWMRRHLRRGLDYRPVEDEDATSSEEDQEEEREILENVLDLFNDDEALDVMARLHDEEDDEGQLDEDLATISSSPAFSNIASSASSLASFSFFSSITFR